MWCDESEGLVSLKETFALARLKVDHPTRYVGVFLRIADGTHGRGYNLDYFREAVHRLIKAAPAYPEKLDALADAVAHNFRLREAMVSVLKSDMPVARARMLDSPGWQQYERTCRALPALGYMMTLVDDALLRGQARGAFAQAMQVTVDGPSAQEGACAEYPTSEGMRAGEVFVMRRPS